MAETGTHGDRSEVRIDAVTRQIIQSALASAADEMAVGLHRTARSTIVRDVLDFSTSICNGKGMQIAQGVTIPFHMGSVPFAMDAMLAKFEGDIHPGDVFILNDPFDGGMHLPDIYIVRPVFAGDRRIAFAVSTAHHLDVGGRLPGSSACDNVEIFQDGFRIPWLKLYERGEPNEAIFTLLRANIRVPDMTMGDLQAQLAACHIGSRAVLELVERYTIDVFEQCALDLIDYTERLVRADIAEWPDRSSTFTDWLDSNGCPDSPAPVKIQCTITVRGDGLVADFTGTDPQVRGAINSTYSMTSACVAMCVRSMMREAIPNTSGIFRPLEIIVPSGTVLNGKMPAASSMRGVTAFRTVDVVFGALAEIVPERVPAAGDGGNSLVIIGGRRPGSDEPYVYYELMSGTWGARPDRDGNDGLCNPANIASNIPIEEAESDYPVRIDRYGLVQDSGGPGEFRGGMAIEREWSLLEGEASLLIRSDRRAHRPYGLAGGRKGAPSTSVLHHADGSEKELAVMISTEMTEGERLYHQQPGAGGFGDPMRRDPAAVATDVRDGRVSVEAAARDYGVIVDPVSFEVDEAKTRDRRGGGASP
ncbi:MAG: 5-oxoprolinase [Phycisphaeraceae bacterium]|nr:5-oxoprolinase [Phycisphaeraceae bacterium]